MSNIDHTQIVTASECAARAHGAALQEAQASLMAKYATAVAALSGQVPEEEKRSWPRKAAAARAMLDGRALAADTALLEAEAAITGETPKALATAIATRAERHELMLARLSGWRRKAARALAGAHDAGAVQAALATALEACPEVCPADPA